MSQVWDVLILNCLRHKQHSADHLEAKLKLKQQIVVELWRTMSGARCGFDTGAPEVLSQDGSRRL